MKNVILRFIAQFKPNFYFRCVCNLIDRSNNKSKNCKLKSAKHNF